MQEHCESYKSEEQMTWASTDLGQHRLTSTNSDTLATEN